MHRALRIHEILARIFTYVRGDRSPQCLTTLAGLARTCCFFRDPALSVLWYELNSLFPLFKLLPLELYETPDLDSNDVMRCWAFRRHVVDEDWKVFSSYASRVRHLRHISLEPEIAASSLQSIAITRPMVTLLPHLRSLEWRGIYDMGILNVIMFIPSTLHRLKIDARERPAALHTLFKIVASRVPRLTKTSIHYSSPDTGKILSTEGLVDQLTHLTNVDVSAVNATPHILTDLASLPSLRQMSMTTLNLVQTSDLTFPSEGFPALEQLDLALPTDLCIHVLQSSKIRALRRLRLYPNGDAVAMKCTDVQALLSSACVHDRADTLTTLVLEPYHKLNPEDVLSLKSRPEAYKVDLRSLSSILPMHALTTLHIKTGFMFNLTDADIGTIVQALPKLKHLHLGSPHAICAQTPSGTMPTLHALVVIAQKCPGIRDLALCVDTTADGMPTAEGLGSSLTLPALETLHVGPSPINCEAVSSVANFLAGLCPALGHMTWMGGRGNWSPGQAKPVTFQSGWDAADHMSYSPWGTVMNIIPFLQAGRRDQGGKASSTLC